MRKHYLILSLSLLFTILGSAQPAPDFDVVDAHGNRHQLYADYLNQGKTVVLKLFFVACPPCNQIADETETLYQDWGGIGNPDVQFIGITIQNNDRDADVLSYENMHGITYPGISVDGGAIAAGDPYRNGTYGSFPGTPLFVVISPDGTVAYDVFGSGISATIDAIDAAIQTSRPVAQPERTITLQIDDAISNTGDFSFSVQSQQQNYPSQLGNPNLFTVPTGNDYEITATKSVVNRFGVSTFDLILIAKHITRQELFTNPKQIIAADINNSNSVSTFDLIELRKYILFINQDFPNNPHWRTIPANFTFTDPNNPWLDDFSSLQITDLQSDLNYGIHPIRVGDVNYSVWNNARQTEAESRSANPRHLAVKDQYLEAGKSYVIDLHLTSCQEILGYQVALGIDPTKALLKEVLPHPLQPKKAPFFNLHQNQVLLNWYDVEPIVSTPAYPIGQVKIQAVKGGWLHDLLELKEDLLNNEVYEQQVVTTSPLELKFLPADPTPTTQFVQIAPNPATSELPVEITCSSGITQIEVLSITGEKVRSYQVGQTNLGASSSSASLSLDGLRPGLYLVQLIDQEQRTITRKLLVK